MRAGRRLRCLRSPSGQLGAAGVVPPEHRGADVGRRAADRARRGRRGAAGARRAVPELYSTTDHHAGTNLVLISSRPSTRTLEAHLAESWWWAAPPVLRKRYPHLGPTRWRLRVAPAVDGDDPEPDQARACRDAREDLLADPVGLLDVGPAGQDELVETRGRELGEAVGDLVVAADERGAGALAQQADTGPEVRGDLLLDSGADAVRAPRSGSVMRAWPTDSIVVKRCLRRGARLGIHAGEQAVGLGPGLVGGVAGDDVQPDAEPRSCGPGPRRRHALGSGARPAPAAARPTRGRRRRAGRRPPRRPAEAPPK